MIVVYFTLEGFTLQGQLKCFLNAKLPYVKALIAKETGFDISVGHES